MFLIRPPVPPVAAERAAWVFMPWLQSLPSPGLTGPGLDLHYPSERGCSAFSDRSFFSFFTFCRVTIVVISSADDFRSYCQVTENLMKYVNRFH